MNYTKEQKEAIFLRKKDILVSAGAGAGKTRVLVDRIVSLLLDANNPIDLSELLVLTFTKATAAEMKERIQLALEEEREKNPGDYRIARQIRKVKNADISTVHSFCGKLLRNYFQELGLDPSFRIGEEGEMKLIRQSVMEELLEDTYEEGAEAFLRFVEAYIPEKEDRKLEEMIENLYNFSNNFPDRSAWFEKKTKEAFSYADPDIFYQSPICNESFAQIKKQLEQIQIKLEDAEEYFLTEQPPKYYDLYLKDQSIIQTLCSVKDLRELSQKIKGVSFQNLPRATKADKEWEYLEDMKALHNEIKSQVNKKIVPLCIDDEEKLLKENKQQAEYLQVIFALADFFAKRYFEEKQRRNLYDFNDMEHLALKLLIDSYEEEDAIPSDTAKELQRKYRAIFIDEYQDTNLVQETLIQMIHNEDENHLFVVGDVKQSIYRFRQARPDLFLARYQQYDMAENEGETCIELRDNFRSAPNVLHYTNLVFYQWMNQAFGGIDYTEKNALKPGENGPMEKSSVQSEFLMLLDKEGDAPFDKLELEAFMIGRRIQKLHEEGYEYRDMAILLRSVKEHAPVIAECLTRMGIPCLCDEQVGYFNTREVSVIMSFLAVIDNVYQDISMAAVLRSSIGGFTNEELARLKLQRPKKERKEAYLYDLLLQAETNEERDAFTQKVERFLMQLHYFRERKKEIPLHELLWEIYQKTGYFYEIMLYPGAEERKENLLMLIQKAQEYEKTVYKGLFYFMRYMEQLQTYEIDLSAGSSQESQEDAVRIMTIHKSKGLEFPVVFVSRIHGKFNTMDTIKPLLFHPEMGVGMNYVDLDKRIEHESFQKKAIKQRIMKETLEEELRILYVAMTRAKEKLIMTGYDKEETFAGKVKEYQKYFQSDQAGNFLDWILAALLGHPKSAKHLCEMFHVPYVKREIEEYQTFDCVTIHLTQIAELNVEELVESENTKERESLEGYLERTKNENSSRAQEAIEKSFSFEYPHKKAIEWKRKFSVSELKRLYQQADQIEEMPEAVTDMEEDEKHSVTEPLLPAFLREGEEEKVSAVSKGTIVHKVMEQISFGEIQTKKDLFHALENIKEQYPPMKKVSEKMVYRYMEQFLFSEIGEKIRKYDRDGKVQKEIPFTVGIPADRVYDAGEEQEFLVVQGVIDACVWTPEGLWLIDYKTDKIMPGQERVLLDRYQGQMLYYKSALEQVTKKSVIKQWIYSFELAEFIEVTGEHA